VHFEVGEKDVVTRPDCNAVSIVNSFGLRDAICIGSFQRKSAIRSFNLEARELQVRTTRDRNSSLGVELEFRSIARIVRNYCWCVYRPLIFRKNFEAGITIVHRGVPILVLIGSRHNLDHVSSHPGTVDSILDASKGRRARLSIIVVQAVGAGRTHVPGGRGASSHINLVDEVSPLSLEGKLDPTLRRICIRDQIHSVPLPLSKRICHGLAVHRRVVVLESDKYSSTGLSFQIKGDIVGLRVRKRKQAGIFVEEAHCACAVC